MSALSRWVKVGRVEHQHLQVAPIEWLRLYWVHLEHEVCYVQGLGHLCLPRIINTDLSLINIVGDARGTSSSLAQVVGGLDHVPLVLIPVELVEAPPERKTTDKGKDGDDGVVPHQKRILGQGDEGLSEGGGKGRHKEVDGHDERSQVGGGLGEGILETGDGGEDLGQTDQDIWDGLDPDIDWRWVVTSAGLVTARSKLVDIVLNNSCSHHCGGCEHETGENTLERSEVDVSLAERWIDDKVHERDHDD